MNSMGHNISSNTEVHKLETDLYSSLNSLMEQQHSLYFSTNSRSNGNIRAHETAIMTTDVVESFVLSMKQDLAKLQHEIHQETQTESPKRCSSRSARDKI